MSETMVEIIGVGLLVLVLIVGIVIMKSPNSANDSVGIVMGEIQKFFEPQVKHVREAKGKKNLEGKQRIRSRGFEQ